MLVTFLWGPENVTNIDIAWKSSPRVQVRKHVSLLGSPYTTCSAEFSNKRCPSSIAIGWLLATLRLSDSIWKPDKVSKEISHCTRRYTEAQIMWERKSFSVIFIVLVTSVAVDMALSMKLLTMKYAKSENVISLIWLGVEINMSKTSFLVQMILSQKFASNLVKI